jgi:hypothetical protein
MSIDMMIQKTPDGKLKLIGIDFDITSTPSKNRKLLDSSTIKENAFGF